MCSEGREREIEKEAKTMTITMRNSLLALVTIILNLNIFIDGLTQELSSSSPSLQLPATASLAVGSMRRTSADKSTPVNSKVSRLRLLLLSELNHNSIVSSCVLLGEIML